MSREYTAQEMRDAADNVCSDFTFARVNVGSDARPVYMEIKPHEVADMLRQAADMMERKKKYEYATKWADGKIDGISPYKDKVTDSISFVEYISSISADDQTGCKLVRREVGEWEEEEWKDE